MGPASILHVTLVPPYGEVDIVVEQYPREHWERGLKRVWEEKTKKTPKHERNFNLTQIYLL